MKARMGWLLALALVGGSVGVLAGESAKATMPEASNYPEKYEGEQDGVVKGVVYRHPAKGIRLSLELADGTKRSFIPMWVGGVPKAGGGYDKAMVEQLDKLAKGDKVEVKWKWVEKFRIVGLKVVEKAPAKEVKPGDKAAADADDEDEDEDDAPKAKGKAKADGKAAKEENKAKTEHKTTTKKDDAKKDETKK